MLVTIEGTQIVNCTPHPIRFQAHDGSVVTVPCSGFTLRATPEEVVVGTTHNDVILVSTSFVGNDATENELESLEAMFPKAMIVGSIISAQAYPGRVVSLVPVPGFERVAPADKLYMAHKFNTFA